MTRVQETIPEALRPEVEAAIAWFNRQETATFEVTGILDPDASLASSSPRELRLVLCGGDRCEQRSFVVRDVPAGYDAALVEPDVASHGGDEHPAELDPPPGALRGWLDRVLPRHEFVVLLVCRGDW